MMPNITFPYATPVLPVNQPIGTFYVAVLPAELLLRVASSDTLRAEFTRDSGYILKGTQRPHREKRLREIADYVSRVDATFPNSIILAANYVQTVGFDQGEIEDMEVEGSTADASYRSKAWRIKRDRDGDYRLEIPTGEQLAAIIDGQHRLLAFAKTSSEVRSSMELVCSIFMDLPKPIQAQIFATINSTQMSVDRSLTYELFGYNTDDEDEKYWTPEKLAVFFSRRLGTVQESPFFERITVAPRQDDETKEGSGFSGSSSWKVSTAVVVNGILRLISSHPRRDANLMKRKEHQERTILEHGAQDRSPLREPYISNNDILIYRIVLNYFSACNRVFWERASEGSFILRSVGVQALFDILRKLSAEAYRGKKIGVGYFTERLESASKIDFAEDRFRVPAGAGRTLIRKSIEREIGLE